MKSSRTAKIVVGLAAMGLLTQQIWMPNAARAATLDDTFNSTLRREPLLTPEAIGDGSIDGLQYADPTENLALVDPPAPNNGGSAQVSYPLIVPHGRGLTPQLELTYDNGGANGWAGLGWDLSVGEISVDTEFGAPRFSATQETESYLIDGDMMVPNALGDTWSNRVAGSRADYTRKVETEYAQIIRHEAPGGGPKNYFWEVRDKLGNVFWYGGQPDDGGPDAAVQADGLPFTPTIDRSATVTDQNGNIVKWLLSAERDVGVNMMRYSYETAQYRFTSGGWATVASCASSSSTACASHTYLSKIAYTSAAKKSGHAEDPAYEIHFLRDSTVNPTTTVRSDPTLDAIGGYLDLIIDRLARVEVRYGAPNHVAQTDGSILELARTYNQVAMRYDLHYTKGAFGKSLLTSIDQIGSDLTTKETHQFEYYDEVTDANGNYDGFGVTEDWNTGNDLPARQLLTDEAENGALGSSETNSGEGHAYIGFNPISPTKVGSFGGALQLGGGATEALAEFIDLNGDTLPDKVYRDPSGNDIDRNGPIRYRLNQSAPTASAPCGPIAHPCTFGPEQTVVGLTKLSTDGDFAIEGSFQAFPIVTVAFGIGLDVTWGENYFSDVNSDGLPDFVSGGSVYFNHLVSGVPNFVLGDSASTPVPIAAGTPAAVTVPELVDTETQLAEQSPLVDTVRRWVAPYGGTISINAPVTLQPVGGSSVDGVRVAIQHNAAEVVAGNLLTTGAQAFTTAVTRDISAGDRIYFRVGSINDGTNDQVNWAPTITYTAITGVADMSTVPLDQNGLSQKVYGASADFTLAGRPSSKVLMPVQGTTRFQATVHKTKVTTDDLNLTLKHNGLAVAGSAISIPAAFVGDQVLDLSFAVARPVISDQPDVPAVYDSVEAYLSVDSAIELTAVTWNPTLTYTAAQDKNGNAVATTDPNGNATIKMDFPPEIVQYPTSSTVGISTPWNAGSGGGYHARVTIGRSGDNVGGTAVLSIKKKVSPNNTLAFQQSFTIPPGGGSSTFDLAGVTLDANADYWVDVTIADPNVSDFVTSSSVVLRPNGAADATQDVTPTSTLRVAGRQGIFPLAYRGWAVAGYNGNGAAASTALDENAFVINTAGLSKDTPVQEPTGFSDASFTPPTPDGSYAFIPTILAQTIPGQPAPNTAPAWKGQRDNLSATATGARTSRLGSDSVTLSSTASGTGRGVTRIGLTAPSLSLAFGIGPLGASFGFAPSFGLVDFEDMNGDGYPDIITPSAVQYTTPRGGLETTTKNPSELAVTNQDLTFAVNGGFSSGLVDIKGNTKGKANANKGNAASKGSDGNETGAGIGIGLEVNAAWTSPNASGPSDSALLSGGTNDPSSTYSDQTDKALEENPDAGTAPIQQALADVNGDGLPDRVYTNPLGVWVKYNLGYDFADAPVKLATGGFESQESYSGGVTFGFSTPWADFGGGVALNWDVDMSRYSWRDVNGDGILDQIHKINNTDAPTVAFGTGTGILPPVQYGAMFDTAVAGINTGQQVTLDRTTSLGGGFEFTISIGPLCLVACYLIINPGASFQNSISSSEIDLTDVDGDGFADSVKSTDDNVMSVKRNKQGRTNMLKTVRNPLGGQYTLDYQRYGNSVEHPESLWALKQVDVNDGRTGDGVDLTRTGFAYSGLKYDRLHRESLGFSQINANEIDASTGTVLRTTRYEYLNDNVFVAGLEKAVTVTDPSGAYLRGDESTWSLRNVLTNGSAVPANTVSGLTAVASLTASYAPQLTQTRELWHLGDVANTVGESTRVTFTYDKFGNVLTQLDEGELEDANDDVLATYTQSTCSNATELYDGGTVPNGDYIGCNDGTAHPSPLWDANVCYTWVRLPVHLVITNGKSGAAKVTYRERDGAPAVCNNNSVTHVEESIGGAAVSVTELAYDDWGSYNRIVYPDGETGKRYAVEYTYDPDNHGNIAQVQEYELNAASAAEFLGTGFNLTTPLVGMVSSAKFEPLSNRVSKRIDANQNATDYRYDALGRIAAIGTPRPTAAASVDLVTYEYHPSAAYGYALAHHNDVFNGTNTIDTAVFVDGKGRVTQTKRDASLFVSVGSASVEGIVVSGGLKYDALGHPVMEYNPRPGTLGLATFDPAAYTGPVTTSTFDLWDLPGDIVEPGGRTTSNLYDYQPAVPGGPVLMQTISTAPNGRATTTYTDIREVIKAVDDQPAGIATALRTSYETDGMGQLTRVIDSAGNATTHSYDMQGRRVATNTPDAGLVTFAFDPEGKPISKVTPNIRLLNQQIHYTYLMGRLIGIDYPGTTPDVTYTYGVAGAAGNGAGRVVSQEDGARITTNEYTAAGDLAKQTAEMKTHQWFNPSFDRSKVRWTTEWTYDALSRIATVKYPDTEQLTYDYDFGGLVSNVVGSELGFIRVQIGVDALGVPIFENQPHTWDYSYLKNRQYDEFFRVKYDKLGNNAGTERTYDPDTRWLTTQRTVLPGRKNAATPAYEEIQDLRYTYDSVGNPQTYRNELPAPVANLFGGATAQSYTYDAYERVTGGSGSWQMATGKVRNYTFSIGYDANGNVVSKNQKDWIRQNNKDNVQVETTYSFNRAYTRPQPHQSVGVGNTSYNWDANGNFLGVKDTKKNSWIRQIQWDATDKMRVVTDGPQVTDYTYDDSGQRTIERGPAGETLFVNPWVTVRNTNEMWKNVWVGSDRLGIQRDDGGNQELKQYFLHKDLQGSTNMVTDITGDTFQHHEYFPTGEVWIDEKSTVFRTPYQYGGGYVDEVRKIISIGARFYDQNREFFYSPDPILSDDPNAMVSDPAFRAAYSYAGSNPLKNVDPSGLAFGSVHVITSAAQGERVAAVVAGYRANISSKPAMRAGLESAVQTRLPRSLVRMGLNYEVAEKRQERADRFASKPLVEINISERTVKFSFGIGKRLKIGGDKSGNGNVANPGSAVPGANAANVPGGNAAGSNGGPNVGAAPTKPLPPIPNGAPQAPNAPGQPPNKPLPPIPVNQQRPNKPLPAIPQGHGGTGSATVNRPDNGN